MSQLSPTQRKALKARAHRLHPVVMIGSKGLTAAVLQEIDANLKSHELIKVKVASESRDERLAYLGEICAALAAQAVQQIGKVLVVYRENPEPPPAPPVAAPAARPKRARATSPDGARRGGFSAARPAGAARARTGSGTARSPRPARPPSGRATKARG